MPQLFTQRNKKRGGRFPPSLLVCFLPPVALAVYLLWGFWFGEERVEKLTPTAVHVMQLEAIGRGEILQIPEADLRGLDFKGKSLSTISMMGVMLDGARLESSNFFRSDLTNATITEADARLVSFQRADISGADLSGSNMREARLEDTVARATIFENVNLRRANIIRSDLTGAQFKNANLQAARVWGATLSNAQGLEVEQLCQVQTLYETKLPPDLAKAVNDQCPWMFSEESLSRPWSVPNHPWYKKVSEKALPGDPGGPQ